ncbi:RNA polymerase sigma factor [Mycobacterium phage Gail]|uniref:RNA polymerase sigma factor n=1 Tax=Mycobacterium phage Gail TaxID=2743994 RepID=A0A7D5FLQ4_9CAUD|nr:sigma-K factor [Mycobacterium phage Gail]QLF84622.1 RNA polymerase sigma factor [Mycobacterium phage Gail]
MDDIFRKAARAALFAWKQDESGLDDLVNDLWVWYLERPGTQAKMEGLETHEAVKTVKLAALQMLSGQMLAANEFNGRNLYSSDAVKEALRGESTNRYLVDILPMAMDELAEKNESYAEAVRSRYVDGVVPPQGAEHVRLVRALKSLTENVNITAITAGVDAEGNVSEGPGSRHSVFPGLRKAKGSDHSDPTADMAINLALHGDEPIKHKGKPDYLCKTYVDGEGVRRALRIGGDVVYSDQTTTLRKEFR